MLNPNDLLRQSVDQWLSFTSATMRVGEAWLRFAFSLIPGAERHEEPAERPAAPAGGPAARRRHIPVEPSPAASEEPRADSEPDHVSEDRTTELVPEAEQTGREAAAEHRGRTPAPFGSHEPEGEGEPEGAGEGGEPSRRTAAETTGLNTGT